MIKFFVIGFVGVILTAVAQVILKLGAVKKKQERSISFLLNPYTIVGYSLLVAITVINLYVLRYLDLKYILIFLPSTYIFVLLFSRLILKEQMSKDMLMSYGLILLGIVVFNL